MSTNAFIAKPVGEGWYGTYHHWDGYPTGLGVELINLPNRVFEGDVDAMIKYLIDDEPVGWSSIVDVNWDKPKSWDDDPPFTKDLAPQSFSARGEMGDQRHGVNSIDENPPYFYVYILREGGISVYYGDKSLGFVEYGDVNGMKQLEPSALNI